MKMLLGAIGYKSNIEGFVDTGWTMNVARIGNVAGLFDRLDFDGAKAVTRDEACQLALNTLKATMVDYGNSNTVVSSNGQVLTVQGSKAQYVTSNNRDINANINRRVISATNNELTLEFGEEHFKDLRLEHDRFDPAYDVYGHPSNEWSYKKVTIGTFKLAADFTFTKQVSHIEDTQATKEKALGLRGYDTYSTDHRVSYANWSTPGTNQFNDARSPFADATQIHINGWNARVYNDDYKQNAPTGLKDGKIYTYDARNDGITKTTAPSLSEIADLTDNGVTVEVYVCPVDADFITDVVVTRTQLMEVDRVASDYVELDRVSSDSKDESLTEIAGYNDNALHVETLSVKDNNYDAYNVLKELKSGDKVAVIPYTTDDGKTWEVGEAYVPETVSGALTNVDIYNTKSKADGNAIAITVGGTTYPIAQWNKDMRKITGYMIKASKKDVTLLMDKMGNALLAKDVGSTDAWIIVGDYYQATGASGRVGWFVHGWTIKGDEIDLDLGTIRGAAEKYAPGELVQYRVAEEGNGEYELRKPNFEARAALKSGELGWAEPRLQDGWMDDEKTDPKYTGEGIYNVAQYANQLDVDGVATDGKYSIKSVNSLLPLEFYNTSVNEEDDIEDAGTIAGAHFNYANANSVNEVSTTAANQCGILRGASAANNPAYNGTAGDDHGFDTWTYRTAPYDGVKFIFVDFDPTNGEVDTISFLDGAQNVAYKELIQINRWWRNVGTNNDSFVASPAEAYVDAKGKVKAVVIKSDSAEASLKDLIVITDNKGTNTSTKNQNATIGAEAPTSGTYYTRQYVSGEDGFKEEKTGYFDRMLSVGTVVTGRLQSDGVFKTRTFHANEYTNRNPDAFYVKGVEALTTLNGKESSTAFYVGPKADGIVYKLGTGVTPSTAVDKELTEANCEILTAKDVMGVDNGLSKEGLIKVDGSTQWIDLRDGRPGDIDDLDDLLARDRTKVELKIILNGNSSSDGFRRAYAILILNAGPEADNASKPTVTITASSGTLPNVNHETVVPDTTNEPYTYTVEVSAGTTVNLTAAAGNLKGGKASYVWKAAATGTVASNTETLSGVKVDNPGEERIFDLRITNNDASRKDATSAYRDVKVIVKATGNGPAVGGVKVTLTLKGEMATGVDESYKVYEAPQGGEYTEVTPTGGKVTTLVGATPTPVDAYNYKITKGYKVLIMGDDGTGDPAWDGSNNGTFHPQGVAVKVTGDGSTNPDKFEIDALDKDLTLWTVPDNGGGSGNNFDGGLEEALPKTFAITSHDGVEGIFTLVSDSTKTWTLEAGGTIYPTDAGTFKVTEPGTGNKVIVPDPDELFVDSADTDQFKGKDEVIPETVLDGSRNFDLYSANKVTVVGNNITADDAGGTEAISTGDGNSAYIAVNTEITLCGVDGAYDGYIKANDSATVTGEAMSSLKFTMADNKDVWITGGVKVKLENVTAKAGSATIESNKTLVKLGASMTLTPADTTNQVVVDKPASAFYAVPVTDPADEAAAKNKTYAAWTKVDISGLKATATVETMTRDLNGASDTTQQSAVTGGVIGVLGGEDVGILVTASAAMTQSLKVNGTDALGPVGDTGADIITNRSGNSGTMKLLVGTKALTIVEP